MDGDVPTVVVSLHLALVVLHSGAAPASHGLAVQVGFNLASDLHVLLVASVNLLEGVPLDVADHAALGPHSGEVNVLLHDGALLPGDWCAFLSPSPNLISVLIHVPVSETVVLGDFLALWQFLLVLHGLLHLLAVPHLEVLEHGSAFLQSS